MNQRHDTNVKAAENRRRSPSRMPGVYSARMFLEDNLPEWDKHLLPLAGQPIRYLEVGCFEAMSAVWMLENVLTHPQSRATVIDPWDLVTGRRKRKMFRRYQVAMQNLAPYGDKVRVFKAISEEGLRELADEDFDIIYIDGDHRFDAVYRDACLAWSLLDEGGLLIFDDYNSPVPEYQVKQAVTQFLREIEGYYAIAWESHSLAIRW